MMATPIYFTILMRDRSYFVDGYAVAELRSALLAGRERVDLAVQPNDEQEAPRLKSIDTSMVVAIIRHNGLKQTGTAAPVAEVIPIEQYRFAKAL